MSKHIPTHKTKHMEAILPGSGSKPALTVWGEKSGTLQSVSTWHLKQSQPAFFFFFSNSADMKHSIELLVKVK